MRRVDGCRGGVVIKGYVGIGESARGNRGHQSFYINGRYMKSNLLSTAVESGCRERVMIGKFPTCVLHLTMPFDTVDVNVHPNKLEVRFQNERGIYDAVEAIVRDALVERDALEKPAQLLLTPEKPAEQPVQVTRQPMEERPTVVSPIKVPVPDMPAQEIRPKAPIPTAMPSMRLVPPVASASVMRYTDEAPGPAKQTGVCSGRKRTDGRSE